MKPSGEILCHYCLLIVIPISVAYVLFLQNHDARIIVAACYEDKARLLLCAVSSFKYLNGSDRAIKHLAHMPTHA